MGESEYTDLIAGCEVNPAVFGRWNIEHDLKKLTTDYEELIYDPELDVIDVCSPNNFYAVHTIAALDAGNMCCVKNPWHQLWKRYVK